MKNFEKMQKSIYSMIKTCYINDLKNNDGYTLKNYKPINYKSGYQVATSGIATTNIDTAIEAIISYGGNCGIWYSNNLYYVDKCKRISTLKKAIFLGKIRKQQSIFNWYKRNLIWL